jgi:hypothetical protein
MFTEQQQQYLLDLLARLVEAMEAPDKLPPMQSIVRVLRESFLTPVEPQHLVMQLGVADALLRIAQAGQDIADAIGLHMQATRQLAEAVDRHAEPRVRMPPQPLSKK